MDASRPILSIFRNPRAPVGMSKYRELLPGTTLKEPLMVFPIIANNLGKIATAAATTLGIVGYINRDRIGRWLSDEEPDPKERKLGHLQDAAGVLETAESIKNLHGQLAPDELDRKHTELLEKLTAMKSDFRVLINEAQSEVITSMAEFEGQLDAQRSETRALGEELREAVADLTRRQDAVEQFLNGKDRGEVFAVPGRQRTAAATPRKQEETGKKPSPNGRRKGNGSTAPETRAP